jgi:hypothetical protein
MIDLYTQETQIEWAVVPCERKVESYDYLAGREVVTQHPEFVVFWVEEGLGRNRLDVVYMETVGEMYETYSPSVEDTEANTRKSVFVRLMQRALEGRDVRLHGNLAWIEYDVGEFRLRHETECHEVRVFRPEDLDALLTWIEPD